MSHFFCPAASTKPCWIFLVEGDVVLQSDPSPNFKDLRLDLDSSIDNLVLDMNFDNIWTWKLEMTTFFYCQENHIDVNIAFTYRRSHTWNLFLLRLNVLLSKDIWFFLRQSANFPMSVLICTFLHFKCWHAALLVSRLDSIWIRIQLRFLLNDLNGP